MPAPKQICLTTAVLCDWACDQPEMTAEEVEVGYCSGGAAAPGERGSRRVWAREEAGAARCLVCLRHAGLDPTWERNRKEAAEERVGGVQAGGGGGGSAGVVCGEGQASLPGLRRVGEVGTARMGRRDLVDVLAAQGRPPLT